MKRIIFFIFLLILIPISVNAEGTFKVLNHYIDSEIEISGNLRVKELIIIDGNISNFTRTLNYQSFDGKWDGTINLNNGSIYNGYEIVNFKASAYKYNDEEIDYNTIGNNVKNFFKELDPKNVKDETYSETKNNNGTNTYKIFYKSSGKTAIYLEYLISNVIVSHTDIKELNYTFKNLNYNADHTYIRVVIPYPTNSNLYHAWVHGNQSGVVKELKSGDESAGIFSEFTTIKEEVNFRITLPLEQVGIDMTTNHSNTKALDQIIKIEKAKENNTAKSKKITLYFKYILITISVIYTLFSLALLKVKDKYFFIIYLILGLVLMLFNYLFKVNIIYLYFILILPIICKLIKTKKLWEIIIFLF